jgi:hypothetical protein
VPAEAPPVAKAIAALIKRQNDTASFIDALIKKVGYPKWSKTLEFDKGNSGIVGRSQDDIGDIIYIPLVRDGENYTNSTLIVKMEASDTTFRMLYDRQYKNFGFDSTASSAWNATNIFHIFSRFDNSIFGTDTFLIKDGRLFGRDKNDSFEVFFVAKNQQANGKTNYLQPLTVCDDYSLFIPCNTQRTSRTTLMPCGHYETYTECTTYWVDMGGGGGSGDTGGDGSGGGGGDWYDSDPCSAEDPNPIPRMEVIAPDDGCSTGWEPVGVMQKLCGYYNFQVVGNSYTGSIKYIQQEWEHSSSPYEHIWTNFVESCLTIPNYGITPADASEIFNSVFNSATNTVIAELDAGVLEPTATAISARMKTLIQSRLQTARPGSVWNTGLCSGNIPTTEASWCP